MEGRLLYHLSGRLQISQFNLNGTSQRELRAKLETSIEQLKAKDIALDKIEAITAEDKSISANAEAVTYGVFT